jgi:hypothetical protein
MNAESVPNLDTIPSDVFVCCLADYLDNSSLVSLARCKREFHDALKDLILTRRRSLLHAKEARKIVKAVRAIFYRTWNPIGAPRLPKGEYDSYIPFLISAVLEKEIVTASLIEELEMIGWGMRMSSAAVKDLVVQKINELRINERTNFKDPHVLNQLGLFAMAQGFTGSFIYRCFAAALVLDPSFLRAKRNFLEFKRRELTYGKPYLGGNTGGPFLGIPADAVDEVAEALLS